MGTVIRYYEAAVPYAKSAQWEEDKHPRDEGGRFSAIGEKGVVPSGSDDVRNAADTTEI